MKSLKNSDKLRITSLFTHFVLKDYLGEINRRLHSPHDENQGGIIVFPLCVNFSSLCEFSSILSQHLLSSPLATLCAFNDALDRILVEHCEDSHRSVKFVVRIISLPPVPEILRSTIPRSADVGRFFALRCTVTRVGAVQVVQVERLYSCSKCGHEFKVKAEFNQFYALIPPRRCPNVSVKCTSMSFDAAVGECNSKLQSFQEIRVNERLNCLSVGKVPRSLTCGLEGDLVETIQPGDDIILNGILTHRWRPPKAGLPCDIETVFFVNSIENLSELRFRGELNEDNLLRKMSKRYSNYWAHAMKKCDFGTALRLRDEIVRNMFPGIYGLYFVKLSLALVLVGAPPWLNGDDGLQKGAEAEASCRDSGRGADFRVRGDLHLLLVGEPSTAKSALLRASCRLAGRAVFTTATGTTAAGLTAAAVRDTQGWALEAGALVLADGGLCAIDEFTSLRGADRAAVHEAMEQQTVSLAKAGLVARLNCRCAVIAASSLSNKAEYNPDLLPTPLLSRFDLVWRLFDPVGCETWDYGVADHVLGFSLSNEIFDDNTRPMGRITWTVEELRNYILWVRGEFHPRLSDAAAIILQRYYEVRRQTLNRMHGAEEGQALAGRTTLRLLESLIRLTQAHARLMARCVTVVEDAAVAVWLMECSIQSTFGSRASAFEVSGHCVSPEETVTRNSMEDNFERIVDVVFATLNLHPDEIGSGWFGSAYTVGQEIRPICMSTQVNAQGAGESESCESAPLGSVADCDKSSVKDENLKRFNINLDFAASVPRRFASPPMREEVGVEGSTEKDRFFNLCSKNYLSEDLPFKKHEAKDLDILETNSTSGGDGKYDHKEISCLETLNPAKQILFSSSKIFEGALTSRVRMRLSQFAFTESNASPSESCSTEELIRGTDNNDPSPKRPRPARRDFLDFKHLSPEDWALAKIDTDLDL